MKVTRIESVTYILVETDEETYYRSFSDSWFVWMGESLESHYNCKEIEALYQEFINK